MPTVQVDFTGINKPPQNQYLTVINFAIKVQHLREQASSITCAQLIQNYLLEQFQQEVNISVEFSAKYTLKNIHNQNDVRTFTGSFQNSTNMSNSLSGDYFFPFRPTNWQQKFLTYSDLDRATNILTNAAEINTKWRLDQLLEVIVSCQLLLPAHHPFVIRNKLNSPKTGAKKRHGTLTLS